MPCDFDRRVIYPRWSSCSLGLYSLQHVDTRPTSNIGSLVHHIHDIAFIWMILFCSLHWSPRDIVMFLSTFYALRGLFTNLSKCHVTMICCVLDEVDHLEFFMLSYQ